MRVLVAVLVLVAISLAVAALAAEQPILVRVEVVDRTEARKVGRIINLDEKTRGTTLFGWATTAEIEAVEKLGFFVEVVPPEPKDIQALTMCTDPDGPPYEPPFAWDCYPTWSQYEDMLNHYATTYSAIAQLVNLGMSGQGDHELWAIKISDNPDTDENEPEVLYTGTMHGDEVVCYGTTVHLIDHILTNYGSDAQVTRLVDETVLWINPLSNPDGTFGGGDHTVAGATRSLPASGFDPNRNFPDPDVPDDPSVPGWATEIQLMMDLAEAEHFTISANCHGGAELFNYPWDVWYVRTPDDQWWIDAGIAYATLAQAASPNGYLTDWASGFDFPGVSNGANWYVIDGGRQDFMNWYHGCREVTLELAGDKSLDAALLDDHFDFNRQALLDYFDLALTGIRGLVTDAITGLPLEAEIRVVGHDIEAQRSWVTTDPEIGDYHRLIEPGTYDLKISKAAYQTTFVFGVVVQPDSDATVVDVQLQPSTQVLVTGVVRDGETAVGIPYATVSLGGAASYGPVTADQNGAFAIPEVWEDVYLGRFEATGYGFLESQIVISSGDTHHEVYLYPKTPVLSLDFEVSDGGLTPSAGWAWGIDTTAGAHSGSKIWGTVLNGDYTNNASWTLDTTALDLSDVDGAELRFWQWYATEDGFDGGNIKVSADSGAFDLVTPVPGYTDQGLSGLDDDPGFDGSADWHEARVDLSSYAGQTVVIRWILGADFSQTDHGWYIDDVVVSTWGGDGPPPIFTDGFENGNTGGWSTSVGEGDRLRQQQPAPVLGSESQAAGLGTPPPVPIPVMPSKIRTR